MEADRFATELPPCVIKVVGVGGGGSNAVLRMVEYGVLGVDFVIMNTDIQALARAPPDVQVVELGTELTGGLGAGGIPDVGRQAAEESMAEIESMVQGADMVFVTAGMGGGTGSGAAEVVAAAAQRNGALTVGVVTRPFSFEGGRRKKQALEAIAALKPNVDALITVANDKLLEILPDSVPINEALTCADDILRQGVVGISDIIVQPGLINVDFADVRAVLLDAGTALMGIGSASGSNRAKEAAQKAVSSPLLDMPVSQASGAVFNVVGGPDLSIGDVNAAAQVINEAMAPDAMIIFGAMVDNRLSAGAEVTVTMVATGFDMMDGSENYAPRTAGKAEQPEKPSAVAAPPPPTQASAPAAAAPVARDDDVPEFLKRLKRNKRK